MLLKDTETHLRRLATTNVQSICLLLLLSLNPPIRGNDGNIPPARSFSTIIQLGDETPPSFFVGSIPKMTKGFDLDMQNQKMRATLLDTTHGIAPRVLHINDMGDLYTIGAIDRDDVLGICGPLDCCDQLYCNLTFSAIFIRSKNPHEPIKVAVILQLSDTNDNAPIFQDFSFSITVSETTSFEALRQNRERITYSLPRALDKDSKSNGVVKYLLQGQNDYFALTAANSGCYPCLELTNNALLDYENPKHRNLSLKLIAVDGGIPPNSGSIPINVYLTDLNDNAPVFTHPSKTIRLIENRTFHQPIYTVLATDADTGPNAKIQYTLKSINKHSSATTTNSKDTFVLDSESGELYLHTVLDYEDYSQRQIALEIIAADGGRPSLSSTFILTILVTDINDNLPQALVQSNTTIMENILAEGPALQLLITDADEVSQGKVTCQIDKQDVLPLRMEGDMFLSVWTTEPLDYEKTPLVRFNLVCFDSAEPPTNTTIPLAIKVGNGNDNAPTFYSGQHKVPTTVYELEVSEGETTMQSLFKPLAIDDDGDKLTFQMKAQDNKCPFALRSDTGEIYLKSSLDYETEKEHSFYVIVHDVASPKDSTLMSSALVRIKVKDINDNAPVLASKSVISILRDTPAGTLVTNVAFRDDDMDGQQEVSTTLISQDAYPQRTQKRYFALKENGSLLLLKPLEPDSISVISLVVLAKDLGGDKQLSSTTTLAVVVRNPGRDDTLEVALPFPSSTIGLPIKQILSESPDTANLNEVNIPIEVYDSKGPNNLSITLDTACNGSMYFRVDTQTSSAVKLIATASILNSVKNLPSGARLLVCINVTDSVKPKRKANSVFYARIDWERRLSTTALWPADSADAGSENQIEFQNNKDHFELGGSNSIAAGKSGSKPFKLSLGNIVVFLLILVFSLAVGFALFAAILWARAKRATSAEQRRISSTSKPETRHPGQCRSHSPESIWRQGYRSSANVENGFVQLPRGPASQQDQKVHYAILTSDGNTSLAPLETTTLSSQVTDGAPILAYVNLIIPPGNEVSVGDQQGNDTTPVISITTKTPPDNPNTPVSCYLVM